jgi:metallo-beta-lactamase family protein
MKLTFYGAARTVTGSMHLLEANGHRILLDCGLYEGPRKEAFDRNRQLPFDPAGIDTLILSHAHLDHSGNIPTLVKEGFQGDVYTTAASRDLCAAMLRDSGHIQEEDAAYVNKKRARRGEPPVEPLYTADDAVASMGYFVGLSYNRPQVVGPGITVTLIDAGHILGSAVVVLDVDEGGSKRRIAFTGDLGRKGMPILRDPQLVEGAESLIIESTYGDRLHDPIETIDDELRTVILDTYKRGGKIIVPSFAVGRTQELVYALHRLMDAQKLPNLPIFVDSPLALNVTEIFRLHPECFDTELRQFIAADDASHDPFGFRRLTYVRTTEASKELNFLRDPAVIISASGMAEAGRILHHLKNNVEDPRNTVLIVGWQAPNTLGRRLVERQPIVKIFGEEYHLRAQVVTIDGFSGHADRAELLDYTRQILWPGFKSAFVVHGEEASSLSLAEALREQGIPQVTVPRRGEFCEI